MSKTHLQVHVHVVWAVKARAPLIDAMVQAWLWPALAECARGLGSGFVVVGGLSDHVHVLADLPPTVALAEFVRRMKGASSYLAGAKGVAGFRWQEGYSAFSVSHADLAAVQAYVRDQAARHANQTVAAQWEPIGDGAGFKPAS